MALSLFAHNFTWCIWPVCVSHWILMAIWVWLQETGACSTKTEEFFFCLVLAVIHIFTFFNVKPDSTRCRYIFYYLVHYHHILTKEEQSVTVILFLGRCVLWRTRPSSVSGSSKKDPSRWPATTPAPRSEAGTTTQQCRASWPVFFWASYY